MKAKSEYIGIDCFRIIAAMLVIAIHTSPLLSINSASDFVLTRVIARLAVPFFFITSSFFLFNSAYTIAKIKRFVRNTIIIYVISIAIYLPLNIYGDFFK